MRVMVIVKANKDSEAGVLPNADLLAEMGQFNETLVKAGVMLAGEGLQASSKGVRVKFGCRQEHDHRWTLHRDQGIDCGLLALAGEIVGRGRRVDPTLAVQEGRGRDRDTPRLRRRRFRREPAARAEGPGGATARADCEQELMGQSHQKSFGAGLESCARRNNLHAG